MRRQLLLCFAIIFACALMLALFDVALLILQPMPI